MADQAATVAELARGRENNFDVLRLAAAALVLVSHSYALVGRDEPRIGELALGTIGVAVFFAISGFLIARSWQTQPRFVSFLVKRALRILPALVLCVVVCAYLLGSLATTLAPDDYLVSTEPLRYVVGNLVAVASGGILGDLHYLLPGVFSGNPAGAAVNGSLWTLPIEVQGYGLVVALGALGLLRHGVPVVAAGGILLLAAQALGLHLPVADGSDSLFLLTVFAVGSLLWTARSLVPLRWDLGLAACVAWLLGVQTGGAELATVLLVPYLALLAAYRGPAALRVLTRHGDVSYGLYLLAFPVQQSILAVWGGEGPAAGVLISLAFVITYALAYASWRLVESPALKLKPRPALSTSATLKPGVVVRPTAATSVADAGSVVGS